MDNNVIIDMDNKDVNTEKDKKQERRKKVLWRFERYFREYCDYTGIHGFKYFGEHRTLFEKVCWIVIFILSLIACLAVIRQTYEKWQTSPVIVNFGAEENNIFEIPFPAVTICNEVKISKKYFNYSENLKRLLDGKSLDDEDIKKLQYMSLVCAEGKKYKDAIPKIEVIDENLYKFLDEGTAEFFDKCIWMGQEFPCYQIFQPIVTDEGLCMTFNLLNKEDIYRKIVKRTTVKHKADMYRVQRSDHYHSDHGYDDEAGVDAYPRRALLSGSANSLTVNMYVNNDDLDYACTTFQGFQVVLHKAIRYPTVQQHYFRVPLGKSVIVAISPTQMVTSEKIREYPIEKRKCLFQSEINLTYFKHYTQYNCKLECITAHTLRKCGCVAYYMPRTNNTPICGNEKISCMIKLKNALDMSGPRASINGDNSMNNFEEIKRCNCMPMCASVEYNTEITESDYDWYKEVEQMGFDTQNDERNSSSQLVVYFKTNHFIPFERNELYGNIDFVANVGGLLGLFIGFSLLSFFEIFYFLTVRILCNLRLYKRWYGVDKKL